MSEKNKEHQWVLDENEKKYNKLLREKKKEHKQILHENEKAYENFLCKKENEWKQKMKDAECARVKVVQERYIIVNDKLFDANKLVKENNRQSTIDIYIYIYIYNILFIL